MLGYLEVCLAVILFVCTLNIVNPACTGAYTCKEDNVKFLARFFYNLAWNLLAVFIKHLDVFCISCKLDVCLNRRLAFYCNGVVNNNGTFPAP